MNAEQSRVDLDCHRSVSILFPSMARLLEDDAMVEYPPFASCNED